jgi:hypothetical protein
MPLMEATEGKSFSKSLTLYASAVFWNQAAAVASF